METTKSIARVPSREDQLNILNEDADLPGHLALNTSPADGSMVLSLAFQDLPSQMREISKKHLEGSSRYILPAPFIVRFGQAILGRLSNSSLAAPLKMKSVLSCTSAMATAKCSRGCWMFSETDS